MKVFISDIKSIIRVPVLLCALFSPVIVLLLLLLVSPLFKTVDGNANPVAYGSFYSVTAITLISAIPVIYGLLFSYTHLFKTYSPDQISYGISYQGSNKLVRRIIVAVFLSFIVILPVIFLTDPVSTEGWLRSIYAALILSAASPFIFLMLVAFGRSKGRWAVFSMIALVLLIAAPAGMPLHHPWNYLAFISPFYWCGWAWVITSPTEGLIYGLISLFVTAAGSMLFYRCIPVDQR
jgi:hypothetical protein